MSVPVISPYTFADLQTPKDLTTNKLAIYNALVANGHTSVTSWADLSVPSALVEVEADALCNFQQATQQILYSGFNYWASGDALTQHSFQIYGNDRRLGQATIGQILLTDTGAGPFTFDPTSMSFSVGLGGLVFNGIADPTGLVTGQLTLPQNGSVYVWVQAADVGGQYNAVGGSINTFVKGALPGVIVTNPATWLTITGAQQGADIESDAILQARNANQWGTLGTGSPQSAYINWALGADPTITRVKAFTNLSILDPGTITLIIAGAAGALPPSAVQNAQNAIASGQVGGSKIPETARCIVSSAVSNVIQILATLYIQGEYNNAAFQQLIANNVLAYQQALDIGQKVSWGRLEEVMTYIAGLSSGIIEDIIWTSPTADVYQQYYQVAVFDLSQVQYLSV